MASAPLILPYRGTIPKIHERAFVAPGAVIIGDVEIGEDSSIWFGCVLRGDVNSIRIGKRTNIQDGTVIHGASPLQPARLDASATMPKEGYPVIIGDDVTVGHMALLHACRLADKSFVGMKATLMDGCLIETEAMLAAGALLTPGKKVPRGELWGGSPAKLLRSLMPKDIALFDVRAKQYADLGLEYLKGSA